MCENFKTWIVPLSLKTWHSKLEEPLSQEGRKTWQWRLFVQSDNLWIMLLGWKQGGRGLRQASAMLHQSPYVNQLVCAVGGVLDFIAKSEWRGGEQKKWKKWNLTCLVWLQIAAQSIGEPTTTTQMIHFISPMYLLSQMLLVVFLELMSSYLYHYQQIARIHL